MEEKVGLNGRVELIHVSNGIATRVPNTVVNEGKALLAGLMVGSFSGPSNMAIGTGSETIAGTETTLGSEQLREGTDATLTTTSVADDTSTFVGSFGVSGTHAIQEAGLFDAASAGSMISKTVFSTINVVSGDSINATWDIQVS